ncbi:MAG: hypothetical protein KKI09_07665 [Spirochaetes bacterium]|nr:hypothetical protein [Spirochaetota bacterium]
MKIRKHLLLICSGIIFLASCASKPPVVEEEPPVVVVEEPPVVETPVVVEPEKDPDAERKVELAALHEEVLKLRVKAVELNANTSFAARYDEADAEYVQGKTALDAGELDTAQSALEKAGPLFRQLIRDSYLAAIQNEKNLAGRYKQDAQAQSVQDNSFEILLLAADTEVAATEAEAGEDTEATLALWIKTRMLYDGAIKHSRAIATRARIQQLDYSQADSGNFALADQKLELAYTLWPDELEPALDAIEEALLRYNLVLAKGWELLAGSRRAGAETNKLKADQIKASVAVADQYSAAKAVWDSAISSAGKGENEYAAALFEQAEELFEEAYLAAAQKRAAAEAAMAAALERQNRSRSVAQDADEILGLSDETAPEEMETENEAEPVVESDAAPMTETEPAVETDAAPITDTETEAETELQPETEATAQTENSEELQPATEQGE